MDMPTAVAIASMTISIMALFAAIAQVNIEQSIEARRKGKTDRLALGEWAITWPQSRAVVFSILDFLHLPSPLGDPNVLTVPFITAGALQDFLRLETSGKQRTTLQRRIKHRLVKSATESMASGTGRFTGRASALACDGAIRPANAVTNLHSLWGFARAMGLRQIEIAGTRITMTNGGASIYLDQYAGVDRPTRLAHFSGSPNGRYHIIEEMSQQTAGSTYADSVWSDGCIPSPRRLEPGYSGGIASDISKRHVAWPREVNPPALVRPRPGDEGKDCEVEFAMWADSMLAKYSQNAYVGQSKKSGRVSYFQLIQDREPAVLSCIRTYPLNELSPTQKEACYTCLLWCIEHWWRDPYQSQVRPGFHTGLGLGSEAELPDRPRLPLPDIENIGPEFITSLDEALAWCQSVRYAKPVDVDGDAWAECRRFAQNELETCQTSNNLKTSTSEFEGLASPSISSPGGSSITATSSTMANQHQQQRPLPYGHTLLLLKFLQGWKLHLITSRLSRLPNPNPGAVILGNTIGNTSPMYNQSVVACELLIITMALLAISSDSSQVGSSEVNKALEIELG